jgi:cytochrome c-type biogenesis protein CcmH
MTLWFIFGLMTVAAILAVVWPLGRRAQPGTDSDLAVYRAQLDEIEADRAAGRVAENEAAAARVEISRRLLAAADAAATIVAPADGPADAKWRRRAAALIALVLIPIGAGSLYLALGSPQEPGQPIAARRGLPTVQDPILDLVVRVEAHLAQNPDDARGWQVVAPVYLQLGRFDDAVNARQNVLRILGASAEREANLGEALTAAAGGIVSADAKAAFERAQSLDANDSKSRFFLGLAAEQDGKGAEAAAIWRDLLAKAPPEARWVEAVRQALARVEGTAPPGPTEKEITAANELAPEQRSAMVQGMVARLAERLKVEGSDVEGWLRLLRSYMVLGERDKARTAAADARRALASEPEKLRRVNELIKGLGLEG